MPDLKKTERPITYRSVRIEDIDGAIKDWFDLVVDSHVTDEQKKLRKVKVLWAAGERWVTGKDLRGVRDKDGRLILPLIAVRRTGLDPVNGMSALGANVPRLQLSRRVHEKTNLNRNAISQRPIASRKLTDSDVYEITTVPFPFVGVARYELVIQAQYSWQLNEIIEKLLSQLEFFDVPSFVAPLRPARLPGLKTGDGAAEVQPSDDAEYDLREPIDKYYVCGYFDGDFTDDGNTEEFTDQERIIKTTLTFRVPAYLQLDPEGKRPAVQRELTAAKISIGDESVCFVDDPLELDIIFGKR